MCHLHIFGALTIDAYRRGHVVIDAGSGATIIVTFLRRLCVKARIAHQHGVVGVLGFHHCSKRLVLELRERSCCLVELRLTMRRFLDSTDGARDLFYV